MRRLCLVLVFISTGVNVTWTLNEMTGAFPAVFYDLLWPIDKSNLPVIRLLNMLALAYVVAAYVPRRAGFLISRLGWLVVLCGQKSLEIFCLSILLSVSANIAQDVFGNSFAIQLIFNSLGIAIMLNFALLLAWVEGGGKLPLRPKQSLALPALVMN